MSGPTSAGQASPDPSTTAPQVERKHPEAQCEDCTLYQPGVYAGGAGPANAKVAAIGEAPGYQEAKHGTPFTGPSGQLLDTVLVHHGLDRSLMYVDNVVACRPPDNRTPTPLEVRCCFPRLQAELRARPLEQMVTLGNTA